MRKAGGTVALIAGIFGVLAALITLVFGGVAHAFGSKGAATVVGLGWGGVFFSFLVIVFAAVAFAKAKVGGWGVIGCSITGAVMGGTLVAIAMVLAIAGGILCLFDKSTAKVVVETTAGSSPPEPKSTLAWSSGQMALYSVFSVLMPIFGFIAGPYSMFRPPNRAKGAALLAISAVSLSIYLVLANHARPVEPDAGFLKSELIVRDGISETGLTVEQFVELLKNATLDNGTKPTVTSWSHEGNEWIAHVIMKKPLDLHFTQYLNAPMNGKASLLAPVHLSDQDVPAINFLMTVASAANTQPHAATTPSEASSSAPAPSPNPSPEQVTPLALAAPTAPASAPPPSDTTSASDSNDPCNGLDQAVASNQAECLDRKYAIANAKLSSTYENVMSSLDNAQRIALKEQQREWLKQIARKCGSTMHDVRAGCWRRPNLDHPCRLNFDQGRNAFRGAVGCG